MLLVKRKLLIPRGLYTNHEVQMPLVELQVGASGTNELAYLRPPRFVLLKIAGKGLV
jgi:hypothetical protein